MPTGSSTRVAVKTKPPVSTRDLVLSIREKIRLGQLVPGQRLVEADIVEEFDTSRSKVRETLQRLETEGLVRIEEFRGATVRQLSMDEVYQIYQARMALESMAAAEFAKSKDEGLKKQLQKLQSAMNELEHTGDHHSFAQLNDSWHALIIKGSGNAYAAHFLSQLSIPVYRLLFTSFYGAQRITYANADHKIITKAIVEGRSKDAQAAMRAHIDDGLTAISEINAKLHN